MAMSDGEVTIIDAHVHLHPEFEFCPFLEALYSNLSAAAASRVPDLKPTGVVFLLSTASGDGFGRLRTIIEGGENDCFGAGTGRRGTAERESVRLASRIGIPLVVIAGRQIVSREGLEVLALGTRQHFEDEQPTEEVLRKVSRVGALPVLPWGVGKWLGKRGRLVEELIDRSDLPAFFVGDSGTRPSFWPQPAQFRQAEARGIKNLPGSDPLPFPSEAERVGRYGAILEGSLNLETPARHLKQRLLDSSTSLQQFGDRETLGRFARNQLRMQLRKFTPSWE